MSAGIVLDVQNLTVKLLRGEKPQTLVDDVSFSVKEGECLGILGESGSGKSMTWKAFMGLLDLSGGPFEITGRAIFANADLMSLSDNAMRRMRGSRIGVILQNPMNCFDPLYKIGYQIGEGMAEHSELSRQEIRKKCIEVLEIMRIKNPDDVLEKYPHQISGGMLQRVMTGIALTMEPDLIIADEPTTAIDSITQFSVIEEFKRIKDLKRAAMIFISHDIGVVSQLADEVIVMHDAAIKQRGTIRDIIEQPTDPYTKFLIEKKTAVMERFVNVMGGEKHLVPAS
jgi:nickel transport system ATP-binding protein